MAKTSSSEPSSANLARRYEAASTEIDAVLAGESDRVARMATVTAMLAASFKHFLWTGFYIVDASNPRQLVVGPYQGALGCLRIDFARGVCGAAAANEKTVIVADVAKFVGHISCDARARSEIVVPVFDGAGVLIAVLDVDSAEPAAFDQTDADNLEDILRRVFAG